VFLGQADALGFWPENEKPFWWDAPLWLATGKVRSVGIAQNHMHRGGVLDSEACGRPRDLQRYPGAHGNGLYTQDLSTTKSSIPDIASPHRRQCLWCPPQPRWTQPRLRPQRGQALTWDSWWEHLAAGGGFVTNGPLLRLTAAGKHPGHVFKSAVPVTLTLTGKLDSNCPIDRIELVQDCRVRPIELPATVTIDRSGWFLVRGIVKVPHTFRFASTAPWYAEIGGEPMPPASGDAQFFLGWMARRQATLREILTEPEQRQALEDTYTQALDYWRALA